MRCGLRLAGTAEGGVGVVGAPVRLRKAGPRPTIGFIGTVGHPPRHEGVRYVQGGIGMGGARVGQATTRSRSRAESVLADGMPPRRAAVLATPVGRLPEMLALVMPSWALDARGGGGGLSVCTTKLAVVVSPIRGVGQVEFQAGGSAAAIGVGVRGAGKGDVVVLALGFGTGQRSGPACLPTTTAGPQFELG